MTRTPIPVPAKPTASQGAEQDRRGRALEPDGAQTDQRPSATMTANWPRMKAFGDLDLADVAGTGGHQAEADADGATAVQSRASAGRGRSTSRAEP